MIDFQSSRKQALKNVLAALDAGQLGAFRDGTCLYENMRSKDGKARFCSVGVLFTDSQRADIRKRGLNNFNVAGLVEALGQENIEEVTGMPWEELARMQIAHDDSFDEFVDADDKGASFRDFLIARISEA